MCPIPSLIGHSFEEFLSLGRGFLGENGKICDMRCCMLNLISVVWFQKVVNLLFQSGVIVTVWRSLTGLFTSSKIVLTILKIHSSLGTQPQVNLKNLGCNPDVLRIRGLDDC